MKSFRDRCADRSEFHHSPGALFVDNVRLNPDPDPSKKAATLRVLLDFSPNSTLTNNVLESLESGFELEEPRNVTIHANTVLGRNYWPPGNLPTGAPGRPGADQGL